MELRDLDREERIALVGLVEFIGESNPEVTDEESSRIDAIVAELGEETYRTLVAQADERLTDEDSLRELLQKVARQDARELIYGAALELAVGDTIRPSASALLDWLAEEWGIAVRFDGPAASDDE